MKTWFHITLFVSVAAAYGCNSTGMSGTGGPKAGGTKGDQNERQGTELGAERAGEEDNEDLASDEPVQVSGAFLTCAAVEVPGSSDASDFYGCVIERQSVKVPNNQFSATYELAAMPDRTPAPEAKIEQADDMSLWHVFIEVPSNGATSYEVVAQVRWKTADGERPEVLKALLQKNGKLNAIRFGMAREFHIGNNDYRGGSCKQRINTTPLYGTTLTLKVTAKEANTRAAFHIKGICGVDYNQAAFVRVRDWNNKLLKNVEIKRGVPEVTFSLTGLAAGVYAVELVSVRLKNNDHDDFVIGDVTIISDKPILGELPQL